MSCWIAWSCRCCSAPMSRRSVATSLFVVHALSTSAPAGRGRQRAFTRWLLLLCDWRICRFRPLRASRNFELSRHGERRGHRVNVNQITDSVIGAAIEVHRTLGPGLLESAYETCLEYEMVRRGIPLDRQKAIPIRYRGIAVESASRVDF